MMMLMLGVMGNMVMVGGSKGRAGKHHQQQGGSKNLLHGKNLARRQRRKQGFGLPASKQERVRRAVEERGNQRKLKPR
jgi:hypothetical protein